MNNQIHKYNTFIKRQINHEIIKLLNFYKTSTLSYLCRIDVLKTTKRRLLTMLN